MRGLLTTRGGTLTAVGVAEVLDHLVRVAGIDEEAAALDLAQLGLLEGSAVTPALGVAAGRLRAQRYHRSRCSVSMADCIAACTARARGESLATSDPHLLDVCRAEGVAVIALPASDGSTWRPPEG